LATRKRPNCRNGAKNTREKGGDSLYMVSLENIMRARKELASKQRELRNNEY
jgi:hypothetical protein